jgi:UDP-glucose 4-epimerase
MKILVTGGAGFIGSNVTDRLIDEGHDVVIIDDLSTGFVENINPKAKFIKKDIRDKKLEQVFAAEKFDIVNHHAAQMDVRKSVKDPRFDADVNIGGSINILENCVKYDVKKIVYISTGGAVYGEPEKLPVSEDCHINPISQYGISKHTVEHYLFLYRMNYGLNYVVLRYPNVFGPRQYPHGEAGVTAIFTLKMMNGEQPSIFGDGEQLRDYTYIADIVEANILAMTTNKGDNEIMNIGTGVGTSVNEIFKILADILEFDQPAIYKEPRIGEILQTYLDASKAARVLGWKPKVSFREGLEKLVMYFRSKGECPCKC